MTISVYTGTQVWEGRPFIGPAKKGRVEHGPGLYFTTSLATARKFSGGSRTVLKVEIDSDLTWLEDAVVPTEVLVRWVAAQRGLRKKREIIADISRNATRTAGEIGTLNSRASVLVNLMVNYGAITGEHGPALAEFLTALGIDASHVSQGREDWIVIFNPEKVVSWKRVGDKAEFDLPRLKRTSR
jgi:hypothetical protein